jgi:FKBP-type peptidyl-prolyl cis-trans isomerase SlyD
MMQIQKDSVVTIHYTVKDAEGQLIDSSDGQEPMAYLHGAGNIVEGLEAALEGQSVGAHVEVTLKPEQAYGSYQPKLVQQLARKVFEGASIEVGQRFNAQTAAGPRTVVVTEIKGDLITIDGNHPLAGQTLNFVVDVTAVRESTEEERAHGHVHGEHGHHHD